MSVFLNVVLNSYAKLNLFLEVLNKRKDNFHNIRTLFERINLADKIYLKPRRDNSIRIICHDPQVPKDQTNLCYRAAKLLRDNSKIAKSSTSGLDIKISKHIPVGAGLGGGSSNAASLLLGLNKLWKLNFSRHKLLKFAKAIGSDVAFFIYNQPFALGERRGDKIKLLRQFNKLRIWYVLVVPKIKVSTPLIYRKWDSFSGLTRPRYDVNILNLALKKNNLSSGFRTAWLFNGLEEITTRLYPVVRRIKQQLAGLGLKPVLMSGSGPAVFGVASCRKEAVLAAGKIKKIDASWRVFVTRTI